MRRRRSRMCLVRVLRMHADSRSNRAAEAVLPQVIRHIDEEMTREELASYVQTLAKRGEITMREGTMVMAVARYAYEHAEPAARAELLREMLYPLLNSSR